MLPSISPLPSSSSPLPYPSVRPPLCPTSLPVPHPNPLICTNQVSVLEARSRVGGRMWSYEHSVDSNGTGASFTAKAELGAQWIQSATGNPITRLAREMRLKLGQQNGQEGYFTASGRERGAAELRSLERRYQTLQSEMKKYSDAQESDVAVDTAFRKADLLEYATPYVQVRSPP